MTRRKLNTVCWLLTSACNSRCTFCGFWKATPIHLDASLIVDNINRHKDANHYLTGGEVFCHPQWRELLAGIKGPENVLLVTNGLLPERTWEACDRYGIRRFSISLDGGPITYRRLRGVDGYHRVINTIEGLLDRGGTAITLMFCMSPTATLEDFQAVERVCRRYRLALAPLIYRDWPQFDELPAADDAVANMARFDQAINASPVVCDMDRRFYNTYQPWREGKLRLPCTAGMSRVHVYEQGNVYWCSEKLDPEQQLGNLYEKSLSQIMASERFEGLAKKFQTCNDCWLRSNRRYDLNAYWQEVLDQLTAGTATADQRPDSPQPFKTEAPRDCSR